MTREHDDMENCCLWCGGPKSKRGTYCRTGHMYEHRAAIHKSPEHWLEFSRPAVCKVCKTDFFYTIGKKRDTCSDECKRTAMYSMNVKTTQKPKRTAKYDRQNCDRNSVLCTQYSKCLDDFCFKRINFKCASGEDHYITPDL